MNNKQLKILTMSLIILVFGQLYGIIIFDIMPEGHRGMIYFITILFEAFITLILVIEVKVFKK